MLKIQYYFQNKKWRIKGNKIVNNNPEVGKVYFDGQGMLW